MLRFSSSSASLLFALAILHSVCWAEEFPAPSEWSAPAGAPLPPGDSFQPEQSIQLTESPIEAGAPVISGWNEIVLPGESFALSGSQFTARTGQQTGTDTKVWIWGSGTGNSNSPRLCAITKVEADLLSAIVPADLPYGMYFVWVENEIGKSRPVCLNRARTTWIGPGESRGAPGSTKRVFGVNLTHDRGNTSHLYVQPAAGGALTPVTALAGDPYAVSFSLPTEQGNYLLWLHNGHGGEYGWATPQPFAVVTPTTRSDVVIPLSAGNGIADDAPRIQQAIVQADQGTSKGTVELGSGVFRIRSGITTRQGVRLKGAGKDIEAGTATILVIETAADYGLFASDGFDYEGMVVRMVNARHGVIKLGLGARLNNVRVDSAGNYFVRSLSPSGQVSTVAGSLNPADFRDGTGAQARFFNPDGIVRGNDGALYVADTGNHVIRRIAPDGNVTTWAGLANTSGFTDGPAAQARFFQPCGIARGSDGSLYVADAGNHAIRRIAPDGAVSTVAGLSGVPGVTDGPASTARFRYPEAVVAAADGTLYVTDTANHSIRRILPDGTVSTLAGTPGASGKANGTGQSARFFQPAGLAFGIDGSILVADTGNHSIRRVSLEGVVSGVAGVPFSSGFKDGPADTALFNQPRGIQVGSDGTIWVADSKNLRIRKIGTDNVVSTMAGSSNFGAIDGPVSAATLGEPQALQLDGDGTLQIVTSGVRRARVTLNSLCEVSNCDLWAELYLSGSPALWIHHNRFYGTPYNLSEGVLVEIFSSNNKAVLENNYVETLNWPVGPGGRRDYENFLVRRQKEQTFFAMRFYSGRTGSLRYIANNVTRDVARGNLDSNKGEQILLHEENLKSLAQLESATKDSVTIRTDGLIDGNSVLVDNVAPVKATSPTWLGYCVAVVRGPGVGQVRRITSVSSTSLGVSPDWRVNPGPGSVVAITAANIDNIIVGNDLASFPTGMTGEAFSASVGIQLDANAFKCFIEGNTVARAFAAARLDGIQAAPSFWNEFRSITGNDLLRYGLTLFGRNSGATVGACILGNKFVDFNMSFLTRYQREVTGAPRQSGLYHIVYVGESRGNILQNFSAAGASCGICTTGASDVVIRDSDFQISFDSTITPRLNDRASTFQYNSATPRLLNITFTGLNAVEIARSPASPTDNPVAIFPSLRESSTTPDEIISLRVPVWNSFTAVSNVSVSSSQPWLKPTLINPVIGSARMEENLQLEFDRTLLAPGLHSGFVTLTSLSGKSVQIGVEFDVQTPPQSPIENWRQTKFGTSEPTGDAADTSDPDGDGYTNFLEYALGMDPLLQDIQQGSVVQRNSTGKLELSFQRHASDVIYTVEASSDLISWEPLAVDPGQLGELITVADSNPMESNKRFIRLRVNLR